MFENIGNFFKKMMKSEQKELLVDTNPTSKDAAKERLHIVLMQDRANVSADFLELMKQEIIDVIKKYIVIDEDQIDVRLTNQENEDGTTGAPSLYANIPILNIRNDIKGEILSQNAKATTVNNFVKPAEPSSSEEASSPSDSSVEENKVEEKIDLNDRTVMIPIIDDETLKNSQKEQEIEEKEEVSSENLEENKENNENLEESIEETEVSNENIEEKTEDESSETSELEENAENEPEELNIDKITEELDSADFEEDEDDDDDVTFDDLLKAAEEEEKKQAEEKSKQEEETTPKKSAKKPARNSKKKNSKAKSKKK